MHFWWNFVDLWSLHYYVFSDSMTFPDQPTLLGFGIFVYFNYICFWKKKQWWWGSLKLFHNMWMFCSILACAADPRLLSAKWCWAASLDISSGCNADTPAHNPLFCNVRIMTQLWRNKNDTFPSQDGTWLVADGVSMNILFFPFRLIALMNDLWLEWLNDLWMNGFIWSPWVVLAKVAVSCLLELLQFVLWKYLHTRARQGVQGFWPATKKEWSALHFQRTRFKWRRECNRGEHNNLVVV